MLSLVAHNTNEEANTDILDLHQQQSRNRLVQFQKHGVSSGRVSNNKTDARDGNTLSLPSIAEKKVMIADSSVNFLSQPISFRSPDVNRDSSLLNVRSVPQELVERFKKLKTDQKSTQSISKMINSGFIRKASLASGMKQDSS